MLWALVSAAVFGAQHLWPLPFFALLVLAVLPSPVLTAGNPGSSLQGSSGNTHRWRADAGSARPRKRLVASAEPSP